MGGTSQLGTPVVTAKSNVYSLGVQGQTRLGTVSTTATAQVYVLGVLGTGIVGFENVWGEVDDYQLTGWVDVLANPVVALNLIDSYGVSAFGEAVIAGEFDVRYRYKPTSQWDQIDDTQDANWTKIAA